MRGFEVSNLTEAELAFVAVDVLDHNDLLGVRAVADAVERQALAAHAVIILSQVPPGFTRARHARNPAMRLYYQVETIIMSRALERISRPEQIVVGCADPTVPLPLAYQEYLMAFRCPILQMSYESAELSKCAINYFLAAQIRTTNELSAATARLGADWGDVARALRNDARVGLHAYLRPGCLNQHLHRDVDTIKKRLVEPPEYICQEYL